MTVILFGRIAIVCAVCFTMPLANAMMPQQRQDCEPERKLLTDPEELHTNKLELPIGWRAFAYSQKLEKDNKNIIHMNLARSLVQSSNLQPEILKQNSYLVEVLEASGASHVMLSGHDVQNGCYRLKVTYTLAN